ncbi:hypothetical protein OCU04_003683 [Sclerotinia nivalis]|uniref:Uncharacterized protein n=1 Tax=Sclerotinia nivalis TaxID=352851 RepID=A0A9X0ASE7_9HELO|nr:hypothetical protein OCU04_003683 [Sclerotinia nivalis]
MLYRRVNGIFVNANDSNEVIKYINGILKIKFGLDTLSKPKSVVGPDDLLLLLVQYWVCNEFVFPIEDDRYDVATIMLFQSYTDGRSAEFVHSSRGKVGEDPFGEAEDDDDVRPPESTNNDNDDKSEAEDVDDFEDELDDNIDCRGNPGSGYDTDVVDAAKNEDMNNGNDVEMRESAESVPPPCNGAVYDEFGEVIRQYKALCYEDICIWIVQNPKLGGRDLLAMEVHLRNYKGIDNKPKPTTFLFRENPLPILCPISHILTRAIRDNAILVDGYTSAEPFFATDLRGQGMKAMKVY